MSLAAIPYASSAALGDHWLALGYGGIGRLAAVEIRDLLHRHPPRIARQVTRDLVQRVKRHAAAFRYPPQLGEIRFAEPFQDFDHCHRRKRYRIR